MAYEKLRRFQDILDMDDFDYVSSHEHIREVRDVFRHGLGHPSSHDDRYRHDLLLYLKHLGRAYGDLGLVGMKDAKEGFETVREELERALHVMGEPAMKRKAISGNYLRKFEKRFLHGLSLLLEGLREAFRPQHISSVRLRRDQLVRYILDEREGLGDSHLFNAVGKYAAASHLQDLDRAELVTAERLLLHPHHRRSYNGWFDLGSGRDKVRILLTHHLLGKSRVYFIFRVTEHKTYRRHLETPPGEHKFRAA